jgi:membrane protease YdiL (CAAX protease family)
MPGGSPWLAVAVVALLSAPAWFDRARRGHAGALLAGMVLFLVLPTVPLLLGGERVIGARWNWSGQLLALAGMLWLAALLAGRRLIAWRDMGFTLAQRPGTWRAVLGVAAPVLMLNAVLASFGRPPPVEVTAETWLYQATLPGLAEEVAFRGVLLALADRAFAARRLVGGAPLGWGGVIVTAAFVAAHPVGPSLFASVLPAAALYLWLRARSGSLLLPIVAHNVWNLSVIAVRAG